MDKGTSYVSNDSGRKSLGTSGMLYYVTKTHDLARASHSETLPEDLKVKQQEEQEKRR